MRYIFPRAFIQDRMERDLPVGFVEWRGNRIVCEPDSETLNDIIDDARHYAHPDGPDEPGLQGLKASARAVLRIIQESEK